MMFVLWNYTMWFGILDNIIFRRVIQLHDILRVFKIVCFPWQKIKWFYHVFPYGVRLNKKTISGYKAVFFPSDYTINRSSNLGRLWTQLVLSPNKEGFGKIIFDVKSKQCKKAIVKYEDKMSIVRYEERCQKLSI